MWRKPLSRPVNHANVWFRLVLESYRPSGNQTWQWTIFYFARKSLINGPLSIAMIDYQKVFPSVLMCMVNPFHGILSVGVWNTEIRNFCMLNHYKLTINHYTSL